MSFTTITSQPMTLSQAANVAHDMYAIPEVRTYETGKLMLDHPEAMNQHLTELVTLARKEATGDDRQWLLILRVGSN